MNTPSDYPDQSTEASVGLPHLQIEGTCCSEEFIAENQEAMFYRDRLQYGWKTAHPRDSFENLALGSIVKKVKYQGLFPEQSS